VSEFCYVTTTGRRTGASHRIEIWYADSPDRPDTIYLLAGGRDRSDWVRNLIAQPRCTVEIDDCPYEGAGRVVEGTDEDEPARAAVYDKYARTYGDLDEWRAHALPIAIDLQRAD
jgi:deazaflavin-dependent oxidoreductase (nitroreductase family)